MTEPSALVCTRLMSMRRMHPAQDNSHACSRCGERVGVYPSGMRALQANPGMEIICMPCAMAEMKPADIIRPAGPIGEIIKEGRDSYDVSKN